MAGTFADSVVSSFEADPEMEAAEPAEDGESLGAMVRKALTAKDDVALEEAIGAICEKHKY